MTDNNIPPLVEIKDLTRIYGDGEEIRALDGVSMKISHGELVTVMGPSGSGKTTLLLSIGGMLGPTSGNIRIDDKNIYLLNENERTKFRAVNIGFVFQMFYLIFQERLLHQSARIGLHKQAVNQGFRIQFYGILLPMNQG